MLPVINRVRQSADFARTVRSGVRSGRRNVVLYGTTTSGPGVSRVGFIVGKNVGNAVTRNIVKRRLRAAASVWLTTCPSGFDVVVRALPVAADSDFDSLQRDFSAGVGTVVRKLERVTDRGGQGSVS